MKLTFKQVFFKYVIVYREDSINKKIFVVGNTSNLDVATRACFTN